MEAGTWLGVVITSQRPRVATQHRQLHWLQMCQADTLLFSETSPGLQVKKGLRQFLNVFLTTYACFWLLGIAVREGNLWQSIKQCGLPNSPNQWLWERSLSSFHRLSGRCLANLLLKASNNRKSHLPQAIKSDVHPIFVRRRFFLVSSYLALISQGTNPNFFVLLLWHICRLPRDDITCVCMDVHHWAGEKLSQK